MTTIPIPVPVMCGNCGLPTGGFAMQGDAVHADARCGTCASMNDLPYPWTRGADRLYTVRHERDDGLDLDDNEPEDFAPSLCQNCGHGTFDVQFFMRQLVRYTGMAVGDQDEGWITEIRPSTIAMANGDVLRDDAAYDPPTGVSEAGARRTQLHCQNCGTEYMGAWCV